MVVDVARRVGPWPGTETVGYDVVVLDRDLPLLHGDAVCRVLVAAPTVPSADLTAAAAGDRVDSLMLRGR
jgi:DNA-binding response OmpR family regulator